MLWLWITRARDPPLPFRPLAFSCYFKTSIGIHNGRIVHTLAPQTTTNMYQVCSTKPKWVDIPVRDRRDEVLCCAWRRWCVDCIGFVVTCRRSRSSNIPGQSSIPITNPERLTTLHLPLAQNLNPTLPLALAPAPGRRGEESCGTWLRWHAGSCLPGW